MMPLLWSPSRLPAAALLFLGVLAAAAVAAVELFPVTVRSPDFDDLVRSAQITVSASGAVKELRKGTDLPIDTEVDPRRTGLIGTTGTPLTSGTGSLLDKQLATDPNLAALFRTWLRQAGVQPGDKVAVSLTGSYPGANIAALAALQTLGAQPIIIEAPASSEWGANLVGLTWTEMWPALAAQGHLQARPIASSLAGLREPTRGSSAVGRSMVRHLLEGRSLNILDEPTAVDEVRQRMDLYDRARGTSPIVAYINVGGETIGSGGFPPRKESAQGLHLPRRGATPADEAHSVPGLFLTQGVPVITLTQPSALADRYALSGVEPQPIGAGPLYETTQRSRGLALLLLGGLLTVLVLLSFQPERPASRLPDPAADDEEPLIGELE